MKKLLTLTLILAATLAQAYNFTNAVKYKIVCDGVPIDKWQPKTANESGDYVADSEIAFTLPPKPTNLPTGVEIIGPITHFIWPVRLTATAAEVAAKAGTNEQVKVNKVFKDKVQALGGVLPLEWP